MGQQPKQPALPTEPIPPAAGKVSGPFHNDPEPKLNRRNPTLTLAVVGGLLAIIALVIGMLFSGPTFVDEEDIQESQTMHLETGH